MNFLKKYFIGDFLAQEPDLLKRANINLVFNITMASVGLLLTVTTIYAFNSFYFQLIKSLTIGCAFLGVMFFLRARKSINAVCHILVCIALTNCIVNIFFVFQEFSSFTAIVIVVDVLFAFHTLGSRWGLFYSACHFLPVLAFEVLRHFGISFGSRKPQALAFEEILISLTLLSAIVVYLIYFYHQAYELAKRSIQKNMEDLKAAKEMAEEMNRLKTNFLSNMSHEIRTPINGILGISQVIELESKDENILSYVRLQQQSGKRLLDTITSILNLSRIEAGKDKLKLGAVKVNAVVAESARLLEELAHQKHLALTLNLSSEELVCLSDETMILQVVNNITGNAIKFTEKGSITLTTSLEGNSFIGIHIADTGIGISSEFLPKIFNPFEQESAGRTRQYEGSGLGLSISKKYIELMGGEINVDTTKGKGSTFHIILPRYIPTE